MDTNSNTALPAISLMDNQSQQELLAEEASKRKSKKGIIRFDDVITFENLLKSYKHVRKGKIYRTSTIQYHMNMYQNLNKLFRSLQEEKYEFGDLNRFKVYEPKEREVVADGFEDKIVQDLLSKNVLRKLLGDRMVYDNYASQPKKGTHLGLQRLERFMRIHAKSVNWSDDGWVLVCDITKFFYNIDHEVCWSMVKDLPVDKKLSRLLRLVIDACTEDINPYVSEPGKGLCIGFQTSQWLAVYYLNALDHFIKEKLHIKCYGRYMDDFYMIHESKEYLEYCYTEIKKFVENLLKMKLNPKTHIHPFSQGVCFLGYHVVYDKNTHQTTTYIRSKSINKMLKRTKKQIKLVRRGKITTDNIYDSLQSWHAYAIHGNSDKAKNAYDKARRIVAIQEDIVTQYHQLCNDWTNLDEHGFYRLKVRGNHILRDVDGFAQLMPRKTSKREAWEEEKREHVKSNPEYYLMSNYLTLVAFSERDYDSPFHPYNRRKPGKKSKAKNRLRSSGDMLFEIIGSSDLF